MGIKTVKKNLVMGAVRGYDMPQLQPFVASLKQSQFNGDLCLLYCDLSNETKNELIALGVTLVPMKYRGHGALNSWSRFWKWIRPFARLAGNIPLIRMVMRMITPLQTSRFYNYKDFLLANRDKYENVFITDVRDVVFQRDPFIQFSGTRIRCYQEDRTLAEDPQFNLPWIKQLFGEAAAGKFRDEPIICSGTILGPVDKMVRYITEMEKLLLRARDIGIGGSDQGLHNYLLRTRHFDDVDLIANGAQDVLTVFEPNISRYKTIDGLFCTSSHVIIPVIHQYDRNATLEAALLKRLSLR